MLEISLASDLECSYSIDVFGYYTCMTINFKLEKQNALIDSIKGQHMSGKEQSDVEGLLFVRSLNEFLSSDIFKKFPNLKVLSVMYFSVENIVQGNFDGAEKLEIIFIINNEMGELTDNVFSGASKLFRIEMSSNLIPSISNQTFAGMTTLQHINFDHNQLKSLPKGIFDDLINLNYVSFIGNIIESLDGDLFKNNLKITHALFSNNHLYVIGSNLLTHLKSLKNANFYNNPCICASLFELGNITVLYDKMANCTEANRPEQKLIIAELEKEKMVLQIKVETEKFEDKLMKCENNTKKTKFAFKCFH